MDFNEETLQHAAHVLDQKQKQFNRSASIDLMKKSVQNLLKDVAAGNAISKAGNFDFIYCAGLFDYLPDRTCRRLSNLFYRSLAPGGLLLFTNVTPSAPNRGSLELILDWHLNYRAVPQVAALGPEGVSEDQLRIESDDTGFNLFLEARKNNGS